MESNLGVWIKDALKGIGRNQTWLAEKIGVQPPQVSKIISGGSEVTPENLIAIADALGKPRIQAFRAAGWIDPIPKANEVVEELTEEVMKLPSNDQQEILAFIRLKHNMRKKK